VITLKEADIFVYDLYDKFFCSVAYKCYYKLENKSFLEGRIFSRFNKIIKND